MSGRPMVPAAPPGLADDVLARRRRRLRIPSRVAAAAGRDRTGRRRRLAGDRDLRAAHRAGQPARAELRHPGRPVVRALVRHRRAGPGRAVAGAVGCPGHAPALGGAGRHRDADRSGARRLRRFPRRLGRRGADAAGRPVLRLPRHHPGAGGRRRARPAAAQRGHRRGRGVLAVVRPARPLPGAGRTDRPLRRGLPHARRVRVAGTVHRHPAQRRRPGARASRARPRQRGAAAVGAVVPRPRRTAADRRVGRHGRRGHAELQRLVGRACFPAWRSSPWCSPSTSSATRCATRSTRARPGRCGCRECAARSGEPDRGAADAGRLPQRGRRPVAVGGTRGGRGHRRGKRQRQDHDRAVAVRAAAARGPGHREGAPGRHRPAGAARPGAAGHAGPPRRDGVPGSRRRRCTRS